MPVDNWEVQEGDWASREAERQGVKPRMANPDVFAAALLTPTAAPASNIAKLTGLIRCNVCQREFNFEAELILGADLGGNARCPCSNPFNWLTEKARNGSGFFFMVRPDFVPRRGGGDAVALKVTGLAVRPPEPAEENILERCTKEFIDRNYVECSRTAATLMRYEPSHEAAQFWLMTAQRRKKLPDVLEVFDPFSHPVITDSPWFTTLVKVTLGQLDCSQAVAEAMNDVQRCQAFYYAGAYAYAREDFTLAKSCMAQAYAIGAECMERRLALADYRPLSLKTIEEEARKRAEEPKPTTGRRPETMSQTRRVVIALAIIAYLIAGGAIGLMINEEVPTCLRIPVGIVIVTGILVIIKRGIEYVI